MKYPKIEVYRKSISKEKLFLKDKNIIAIASDSRVKSKIPFLDLNNVEEVSKFITKSYHNEKNNNIR